MGEMEVPADALYGASTQRAVLNFPISGTPLPRRFLRALALVKLAAAVTNRDLGLLDAPKAEAIVAAAREVADGASRRPVPDRRLPDGLRDLDQHEHERGHRAPGGGAAGRDAGPSQRRRQHVPVLQRHDPDGTPAVRGARDRGGADPRADRPPGGAGGQGRRVLGRRQDRPHPPPGRDADPARPGVRGLRRPGRGGDPPRPGRARRAADGAAGRHGGRHRDQRPPRVRGPRLRPALAAHRPPRARDAQPLPRPGLARRRDRRPRRAAGDRARPVEDRERHPADGHGPARRPRRARPARDPARLLDHARQGEPGDRREPDDGRRPRGRQRRHGRVRPDRARCSSST